MSAISNPFTNWVALSKVELYKSRVLPPVCYGYGIKEMESGLCVGDVALFLLKVGTRVPLLKSLQMSYICRPVVLSILARRLKVSPCIHKLNELINNTCS